MNMNKIKKVNWNKLMRMVPMQKKRNRGRNTIIFSIIGAVAGGAIYSMTKGKNSRNMLKQFMPQLKTTAT